MSAGLAAFGAAGAAPIRAEAHEAHELIRFAALDHQLGAPPPVPERPLPAARLRLRSSYHEETLDVVPFDPVGRPDPRAFARVDRFFRSGRGHVTPTDPRLVEQLLLIARHFAGREILLVSGHRRPGRGTGKNSYHVRGMAADISVAGVSSRELYKVAKALGVRGIGYYPRFVHLDVRDVPYRWSGR